MWGITVEPLTPQLARQLGLNEGEKGVVISSVDPGSPAAEAGLRPGDVIKEVDRQEIKSVEDYNRAMAKANPKEGLLLLIKRGAGALYVVLKVESSG